VCRLLRHMDEHGYRWCMPDNDDPTIIGRPFIDFSSGYIRPRSTRSRVRDRWRRGACSRNYARDILSLKQGPLEDGAMEFSRRSAPVTAPEQIAA
jgi:monooxygenase